MAPVAIQMLGLLLAAPAPPIVAQEPDVTGDPTSPIDVYEWSIWVGGPSRSTLNAPRAYPNAMPGIVGTSRPLIDDEDRATLFPIAPISVVQFFGEPSADLDVDLRLKEGTFLAHWPPSTDRGGRLQWFEVDLEAEAPASIPLSYIPPEHWFQTLRDRDGALYLTQKSSFERFVAYDAELPLPIPLRIRGGPDEYTLQNLTGRPLADVAVIAPAEGGFRVGWIDELPTAVPEADDDEDEDDDSTEPADDDPEEAAAKASAFLDAAEATPDEEEEPEPLPAEGDANVKALVDQVLSRPIAAAVAQRPRREVLELIASQARIPFEVDEAEIADAEIDLSAPIDLQAEGLAARDALADVLGDAGLSYRITGRGQLFITTSARLAEDLDDSNRALEGPPVAVLMSQPLDASEPSYGETTRDALARRLADQGLRDDLARVLIDQYGPMLFEPDELIVLAHLAPDAIDEAAPLDVFPPPRKLVRVALVVVHGVDPRLQDRARDLVQQLGDPAPDLRDAAETKLFELGPVIIPALEDALTDQDVEVVFRAERLLLRLDRPVP